MQFIEVWINGERTSVSAAETIDAALARSGYELRYAAVVVNETVIARETVNTHRLREGDRIEVLMPFAGG
jgi:thiamine biosynthesis protein ThiS